MSNTVCVRTFANELDAEIAKDLLEANGIKAAIVADDAGGMLIPFQNEVKLLVMEEDAALAQDILSSAPDGTEGDDEVEPTDE